MAVVTYTKSGAKATTAAKLDRAVFAANVSNYELLKLAYTAYLANGRQNSARTKTRGLVRGGGKKPWRQKGTGRARFGSSRNPIWRGGGIAFGPTGQENYSRKLPLKAKRLAIRQSLTLAANDGKIIVLESLEPKAGKTTDLAKLLNKIGATGQVLLAVEDKNEKLARAAANLANVALTQPNYLNVYNVMNCDKLVITNDALKSVQRWLGGSHE
jgi:large subunit ribosomal protein L4